MAMTARLTKPTAATLSGHVLIGVTGILSITLLAVAYRQTNGSDPYLWFWAGLLVGVVPAAVLLVRRTSPVSVHRASLLALAVLTYVPKVLRDSHGPALFDEVLHYGQILKIASSGSLSVPNSLVPVLQYYPGGDALVVAVHDVTGLSLWNAGLVIAGVAHVALLAGVYVSAKIITGGRQLAGVAAVIYAASPGFTFFSTQVAYESIALPLALWSVIAVIAAARAEGARRVRLGLAGAAGIVATGVTHHVTSLLLAGVLFVLAVAHLAFRRDLGQKAQTSWMLFGVAVFAAGFDALWIGLHSWHIVAYVSPNLDATFAAVQGIFDASEHGHVAFAGSTLPGYEQIAGLVTAPLMALLVLLGLVNHRALGADRPLRYTVLLVAVGFPLSLPLEFMNTGLVWAHRAWPYLYVGVAIVCAVTIVRLVDGTPLLSRPRWRSPAPVVSVALTVALASLVLVGNTATEVNAQIQFPNQPIFAGAASLDSPAEQDTAAWLADRAPAGARFVADPDVAVDLISYTSMQAVSTFPTWLLTESTHAVSQNLLHQLSVQHIDYLIVDTRMYAQSPARGYVYQPYEPGAFAERQPVPVTAWNTLVRQPWAKQIHTAGSLVVFQVVSLAQSAPGVTEEATK